jgi:hypothetical protein
MQVDLEDRRESPRKKVGRLPYLVLITLSAITLMIFAYLHSTGWGITIDLKKLADAFVVNGQQIEEQNNPHQTARNSIAIAQPAINAQQQSRAEILETNQQPRTTPPVNWDVQLEKFNNVFIQHRACDPNNMKWSQMECSNFRARAMKRFQKEWSAGSFWDGYRTINNSAASEIVNSELSAATDI